MCQGEQAEPHQPLPHRPRRHIRPPPPGRPVMASPRGRGQTAPGMRGVHGGVASGAGGGLTAPLSHAGPLINCEGLSGPREPGVVLGGGWGENRPFPSIGPGRIYSSRNQSIGPVVPELIPAFHVFNLKA